MQTSSDGDEQDETNESITNDINRIMYVADIESDEESDLDRHDDEDKDEGTNASNLSKKDEIAGSLPMRRTKSSNNSPSVPSFFTFDGKPKTRSKSPYMDDRHVTKLKSNSLSAFHKPSPLNQAQKSISGTITSPSPISISGRPPKHSPRSDASPSPHHLVLDKPMELTRAASTQSYLLKYSKTRKQSPWQRFVSQGNSTLQRRLSGSSSAASESNYSPPPPPQTISIPFNDNKDKKKKQQQHRQQKQKQSNHQQKQQQEHFKEKSTSDFQNSIDNDSIGSIPSEPEFNNDAHNNDNDKFSDNYDDNVIISSSDGTNLHLHSTQSVDNSIFRCDTPVMRNRIDPKEERERGKTTTQRIIEEIGSEDSEMIKQGGEKGGQVDEDGKDKQIKQKLSLDESMLPQNAEVSGVNTQSSFLSMFSYFHSVDKMSVLYLAVFAIIGSTIRVFLARIFGNDCEFPPEQKDYLSPLSTCVTASGETSQSGGALFIDLPANMIGSFVLGVMTPLNKEVAALPWLKNNHPLQNNGSMHASIRTGFCGSLTTFSSWNTQMIVMMIGKNTALGVQIVPALMGYLLGLIVAIFSFLSGRQCAEALDSCRNQRSKNKEDLNVTRDIESNDQNSVSYSISTSGADTVSSRPLDIFPRLFSFDRDDEETVCYGLTRCIDCIIHGKFSPVIFTMIIFSLFVVGDFAMGSSFHRSMWVTSLMAPLGTIIRWRLSFLNGKLFQNSERFKYIPMGTLVCNVAACIVSALCAALAAGLGDDAKIELLFLNGIKVGFAGNLSTVSTFVKEIVHLSEKKQTSSTSLAYSYAISTIVLCCSLSLCIYTPTVFNFGTNSS